MENNYTRRKFIGATGTALAGSVLVNPVLAEAASLFNGKKKRYAMVGTGHRGTSMWGMDVLRDYSDYVEFVGLCDKNIGRAEYAKKNIQR